MSDSPDGVLQRDQAADFFLWLPRYAIEGRSLTCLVDVCRASNSLIGSGTGDLARELAEALGLNGKEIASWSIEPFNTPFYAHDIDADDLLDYMIPAWRLELRIDDWDGPAPEPVVGPISFWGYDETWIRDRAPWDFSAHETIVIALNGPDPDLSFLDAVR
ncbi:MAG TPA: hypothetical protein VLL08_30665, partial [Kineosporiaceae bacterium]|nr:hypothetical protein [Kineosporiaceae bacterium]